MKIKKIFPLIIAFFLLISCSDKNLTNELNESNISLTEQENKILFKMREPDNRVSMDEVMMLTNEVIGILDGETAVKSGSGRSVVSMSALVFDSKPALKSSDSSDIEIPDTLAHILNFNDSLGFAIISADTRIDYPILTFTDAGSLIDETDNPGIAIFLENLEDYIITSIVESEQEKDSLMEDIMEKLTTESDTKGILTPFIPGIKIISTDKVAQTTPLIPVEWGQESPFNNNVGGNCAVSPRNTKGNYLAGCVAVAVAHIMSYWKHPAGINGCSFNWSELNQYTSRPNAYPGAGNKYVTSSLMPDNLKNQLANLLQQIGKGVSMNYGCNVSSAKYDNSVNFLSKQGFKTEVIQAYNESIIIKSLNNKRPLMAAGCSKRTDHKFLGITVRTTFANCHQWVIDGYLKQRITIETTFKNTKKTSYIYPEYVHNNWGWEGLNNGYFPIGVFNSNLDPLNSNTKSDESYNYQHRIGIVPNIHR